MSVLEIGSASAFFLARSKPFVKDVTGIEQNVVHKEFANALDIPTFNGFENIEDKKFDIIFYITFWNILSILWILLTGRFQVPSAKSAA